MAMLREGRTSGKYAEQFPEFCYRKPLLHALATQSVRATREFPPAVAGQEYPRFMSKPRLADTASVMLLDFRIDCSYILNRPGVVFTLHFLANEYTPARENRCMLRMTAMTHDGLYDREVDMLLQEVFQYPKEYTK